MYASFFIAFFLSFFTALSAFAAPMAAPEGGLEARSVTITGTHTGQGRCSNAASSIFAHQNPLTATYYDTGLGACGWENKDTDLIVAVGHGLFDGYP